MRRYHAPSIVFTGERIFGALFAGRIELFRGKQGLHSAPVLITGRTSTFFCFRASKREIVVPGLDVSMVVLRVSDGIEGTKTF
jgi:hypothetical protein